MEKIEKPKYAIETPTSEKTDRESWRAVRQLIIIHPVDKLNIMEELGKIATAASIKLKKSVL